MNYTSIIDPSCSECNSVFKTTSFQAAIHQIPNLFQTESYKIYQRQNVFSKEFIHYFNINHIVGQDNFSPV